MINKPPPFMDLSIRIPFIIPIKGRGVIIIQGSGLYTSRARGWSNNLRQAVLAPALGGLDSR